MFQITIDKQQTAAKDKQPEKKSPRRKKRQFSKCWLAACIIISIIFTVASFVLSWFDKNPVSELAIAVLETMWGASGTSFIGYVLQNCVRDYTAAKFGIIDKLKQQEEEDASN